MRKPHKLTQRRSLKFPYRIAFIDTETHQLELPDGSLLHQLKLGYCIITHRHKDNQLVIQKEFAIFDTQSIWKEIAKQVPDKTRLIIVAHNISYDMTVLHAFTELPKLGYKIAGLYKEGVVGFVSFKRQGREILFVDNGNFFQGTLKKWGDIVGLSKIEIDFSVCTDDDLLEYCINDVNIMVKLWQTWLDFIVDNRCGEFRITTSSTAFNTYRHRFMPDTIYIHAEENVINYERQSYRGGRTECLFVGSITETNFYYVDINSMYGHIMANCEFPRSLLGYSDFNSIVSFENKLEKYCIVADITVKLNEPFLPYTIDDHTVYPIGEFRTTLSTPEIKYVYERGWVKKIHWLAWYQKSKLFTEYINEFYNLRQRYIREKNIPYSQIAKLFVNSLYGKFGQLNTTQLIIGDCSPEITQSIDGFNLDTGNRYHDLYLGGSIIRTIREGESYDSFPAIAAHVTAEARCYLYSIIQQIPKHHVYYMDTDSLIVDNIGLKAISHMLSETAIGQLKIEHQSTDLTIYAPKDYRMGDRIRTKGISKSAIKIDDTTYQQTQWASIRGMIRSGYIEDYRTKTVTKHLSRIIYSGMVQENGWIEPYEL